MRELIFITIGLWIGGFVGVFTMCLFQINRCNHCLKKQ